MSICLLNSDVWTTYTYSFALKNKKCNIVNCECEFKSNNKLMATPSEYSEVNYTMHTQRILQQFCPFQERGEKEKRSAAFQPPFMVAKKSRIQAEIPSSSVFEEDWWELILYTYIFIMYTTFCSNQ